ncbi:hypothetical protein DL96DRAFT_1716066 [Flagelloscypha sp. PMI_526]|nr:hypothetical protein DL96DRAFT_1716066 [Flagelloscypha sp. PMI_526]
MSPTTALNILSIFAPQEYQLVHLEVESSISPDDLEILVAEYFSLHRSRISLFVSPKEIKLPNIPNPVAVQSVLSTNSGFQPLPFEWDSVNSFFDSADDLHLVVVSTEKFQVNVYDASENKVATLMIKLGDYVGNIIPRTMDWPAVWVYKVFTSYSFIRFEHAKTLNILAALDLDSMEDLDRSVAIRNIYPWGPPALEVHLSSILSTLPILFKSYRSLMKAPGNKAPFQGAEPSEYMKTQREPHPVYDGRRGYLGGQDTIGPPIELFHPCFEEFVRDIESIKPTPQDLELISQLLSASSVAYLDEKERERAIHSILAQFLGPEEFRKVENPDGTKPSWQSLMLIGEVRILKLFAEWKNEIGASNSVPDIQAALSARNAWKILEARPAADRTCCPCFLLAGTGPHFQVLGSILTREFIVQPLTPYLSASISDSYHSSKYLHVARVFCALRKNLVSLTKFWNSEFETPLEEQINYNRFFPYQKTFERSPGQWWTLEYISQMDEDVRSVAFKARLTSHDDKLVVVKFAESGEYGAAAHRVLASHDLAPQLYYAAEMNPGSKFWMIAMDYVDGETLFDVSRAHAKACYPQMERAIEILHQDDFVFGDLREQNIMVSKEGKCEVYRL